MTSQLTHLQVRFQYRKAMGSSLGILFHRLADDCTWLHIEWAQYEELYGASKERVDLLNSSAGLFFRIVQDSLWAEVLLRLCRLTDPPKSCGRATMTLMALPPLLSGERFERSTAARVKKLVVATRFAKDWRNRHLAHNDLQHSLTPYNRPLAKATRLKVRKALRALAECLNHVQSHYCDSTTVYDFRNYGGDVLALLSVIQDGLEANDKRVERLRSGSVLPEDLVRPRPV